MHTALHHANPFGPGREAYAWENVPWGAAAHLDFGCGQGAWLDTLRGRGVGRLAGVEVSQEHVARAKARFPHLDVHCVPEGHALPFDDEAFSSASLLDVLEHVPDQARVLGQLNRVLRPGAHLIVTVPGQHLFSPLDTGNVKFRFPRLHEFVYSLRHSRSAYRRRYRDNSAGLVGDVSARKRWHEHFDVAKLARLLDCAGFHVVDVDGSELFGRLLLLAHLATASWPSARTVIGRWRERDKRAFASGNLFVVAHKR